MQGVFYGSALIIGAVVGWFLLKGTIVLISARVASVPQHWLIKGKYAPALWAMLNGLVWLGFVLAYGASLRTFECIFVFSVCLTISTVDIMIRKIPNDLLLSIIVAAVAFLFLGNSFVHVKDHILGMAAGAGIFLTPFFIGRRSGAGDVKYAASIGIFLGLYYSILAFVIMSALFFLYTSILFISNKGGFKTKTALGPYMSMGFFVAFVMLGGVI